jgi:hypothetical protein
LKTFYSICRNFTTMVWKIDRSKKELCLSTKLLDF